MFEFLRDGSYSQYWAFDDGLKKNGDEYCKTEEEYPKVAHGNDENTTVQGNKVRAAEMDKEISMGK